METVKNIVKSAVDTATSVLPESLQGSSTNNAVLTKMTGCPIAQFKNSMSAGPTGPVLLQDHVLLEKITQFDREKIPARNVHALGTGAYGHFTVTNDISKYTIAKVFSQVGKKTPLFARFSGIFTEQGDPDTTRDPRGFAIKFYTEEGNWDLMGINTPVFNVRDAKLGPDAVHAFKRDPRTGLWNPTQTWDFTVNHPEGLHQALMIFSDRDGTPMSYRMMHAYGCHTFSFINAENKRSWVKFHIISNQGAKGLTATQAKLLAGEDPNFLGRDLHQAIEKGNFPTWRLCCQIMPEDEGYKHAWTFDPTKVWKHDDYPLIDIGTIEINKNPTDYFSEVEQVAFAPTNIVPGLGYSPDKLLQGRLLIYNDTQHHRIGPNYLQLPINRPRIDTTTLHVGGNMHIDIKNKFPHYHGSSFGTPRESKEYVEPPFRVDGPADYYNWPGEGTEEDYYAQPRDFWDTLNATDKNNLCYNLATSLDKVSSPEVVTKALQHFYKISQDLGETVEATLHDRQKNLIKKTEGEMLLDKMNKVLGVGGLHERPVTSK